MCERERARETDRLTDLGRFCYPKLLLPSSFKKFFYSKVILRMECLMFLLKKEKHMNKNGDLKKVIHTMTTLLIHFSFPRVPCDSKSIYSFAVQKQLMSYIMCECNWQDTPSTATVECLLRKPSTPAIKAQDKKRC